jgi:ADP-ribosylglycohydrolase
MILNRKEYLDKVLGCWMGKNIGGTLGAPFEWRRQVNDVKFYTQELHGEPLPNDDLDIQLLWLIALEERGIAIEARTLADYWCQYVAPHWSEYGTGKANMRSGLLPPLCGSLRNDFKDSCGAFIRSEIWACIAPGQPAIAARYAYEDAVLDHGNGEGTYAEVFCAALESAAFVVSDLRTLIDIGLSYIPATCGVAQAVKLAVKCCDAKKRWLAARDEILRRHRGDTFFGRAGNTSPQDHKKGFAHGKRGYDVPSNIGIMILGLLYGGKDFGRMICTTVNGGEDTDCTGATAGSIYGIIHGIQGIPRKWIDPIGRGIKTVALNLGDLSSGKQIPQTVDELTERTARVAMQVMYRQRKPGVVIDESRQTDLSDLNEKKLQAADQGAEFFANMNGTTHRFDFFRVEVGYGDAPLIRSGEPKALTVTIHNTYRAQANISVCWYLPAGWQVLPATDGVIQSLPVWLGDPVPVNFTLLAETVDRAMNRAVLELTIEGRPTVMLVPITLLNGNLQTEGLPF